MAKQKKSAAVERKRLQFRTREVMDFDPSPTILHNQEDIDYYLEYHRDPLPHGIIVVWCDPNVNFWDYVPRGVYLHPQVLAFGVHLPLSVLVHRVLDISGRP